MDQVRIKEIIIEAGDIIRRSFHEKQSFKTKSNKFDPVTKADHDVEAFLMERLEKEIPGSSFMAEETQSDYKDTETLWVIDPIDGTINFLHHFPFICISVGLMINGKIEYGFVYNPILEEFFHAKRGEGAFLNDEPIRVSRTTEFHHCLLATGFPYDFDTNRENNMRFFEQFHKIAQGIRRPGSAALDLCYVAAGKFDGFWEWHLKPWDVAAGILIIEEAGGIVSNFEGNPFRFGDRNILAANPILHEMMLREIRYLMR